jgi:glycosyltransferase involved in cell wall biosynthesis
MYRVAVIIPFFNNHATISSCVQSILYQENDGTFFISQVIVVDDGSLVPLNPSFFNFPDSVDFQVVRQANGGVASARNAGLRLLCNVDFVSFLDADDRWHFDKTRIQLKAMINNDLALIGARSVSHSFGFTLETGGLVRVRFRDQILSNRFLTSTVIINMAKVPYSELYFPVDDFFAEEGDLFLRIMNLSSGAIVNQILVDYSSGKPAFGSAGASGRLLKMQRGELRNYRLLFSRGHIDPLTYGFLIVFSLLKFLRRILITLLRRVF